MADESGAAPGRTHVGAAAVLERLWGVGHDLTLVDRLTGGETGAFEVRGRDGERLVLKWSTDPEVFAERAEAVALTERLRTDAGWPVPRQEVVELPGLQVTLQELLPGEMVTVLTQPLADQLLALHERRKGLAWPEDRRHFGDELVTTLTVGGRGYCRHDTLRAFDDRTRRLDDRIVEIGGSFERRRLPQRRHRPLGPAQRERSGPRRSGDGHRRLRVRARRRRRVRPGDAGAVHARLALRPRQRQRAPVGPRGTARSTDAWRRCTSRTSCCGPSTGRSATTSAAELDLWLAEAERRLPPG